MVIDGSQASLDPKSSHAPSPSPPVAPRRVSARLSSTPKRSFVEPTIEGLDSSQSTSISAGEEERGIDDDIPAEATIKRGHGDRTLAGKKRGHRGVDDSEESILSMSSSDKGIFTLGSEGEQSIEEGLIFSHQTSSPGRGRGKKGPTKTLNERSPANRPLRRSPSTKKLSMSTCCSPALLDFTMPVLSTLQDWRGALRKVKEHKRISGRPLKKNIPFPAQFLRISENDDTMDTEQLLPPWIGRLVSQSRMFLQHLDTPLPIPHQDLLYAEQSTSPPTFHHFQAHQSFVSSRADFCATYIGNGEVWAFDLLSLQAENDRLIYWAASAYPSWDYRDHANVKTSGSGTIQIWTVNIQDSRLTIPRLCCTMHHAFGSARQLSWYPLAQTSQKIIGVLAAVFSDGWVRVFAVPGDSTSPKLSEFIQIPSLDTSANATCLAWSIGSNNGRVDLLVGYSNGAVILWNLEASPPTPLFGISNGTRPILKLEFCPYSPDTFLVAAFEPKLDLVTYSDPFMPTSLLTTIPFLVEASFLHDPPSCIIADSDHSCRIMFAKDFQDDGIRRSVSFAGRIGPTRSVATSMFHNVVASTGSSDGQLWLTWVSDNSVIMDRAVMQISLESNRDTRIDMKCSHVGVKGDPSSGIALPPKNSFTKVVWSRSPNTPGLLAMGTTSGLLILYAADLHLLQYINDAK